jgi:hypothetical protein
MSDLTTWQSGDVIFMPDGRLVLSARIMTEVVVETPGCRLWVNEKTGSVGIKLLRGEPSPPVAVERVPDPSGGLLGVISLDTILSTAGLAAPSKEKAIPWRYFAARHLLEVKLEETSGPAPLKKQGFLDDYPGLED